MTRCTVLRPVIKAHYSLYCCYALWSINRPPGCEQSCLGQYLNQTAANVLIWIFTNFNWGKPRAIKTMNRHKTATHSYLVYWKARIWPSLLKTTKSSQKSIKTYILTKQIKKFIEQNRSTSTYMMSRVHRQPKLLAKSIQQLKTLKFQLLWPCIKS